MEREDAGEARSVSGVYIMLDFAKEYFFRADALYAGDERPKEADFVMIV